MRNNGKFVLVLLCLAVMAACSREVIHPNDEPVKVITGAEKAFAQDFRHQCRIETSGNSGPGGREQTTFELAGRYRFHMTIERTVGSDPPTKTEIILRDNDGYRRDRDQPWQRLTAAEVSRFRSYGGGAPLLLVSAMGYGWEGQPALKFAGRATVAGQATLLYEAVLPSADGSKTVRYWIGVHDGLPHKTEESSQMDLWGSTPILNRATMTCSYGGRISVAAPM